MDYLTIKSIHVSAVAASYALFVVRGVWMLRDSPLLARRWVRIVPHVIDTVLLASAIALRRGRTKRTRLAAWLAAQAVFIYIVTVAVTKNALPFPPG